MQNAAAVPRAQRVNHALNFDNSPNAPVLCDAAWVPAEQERYMLQMLSTRLPAIGRLAGTQSSLAILEMESYARCGMPLAPVLGIILSNFEQRRRLELSRRHLFFGPVSPTVDERQRGIRKAFMEPLKALFVLHRRYNATPLFLDNDAPERGDRVRTQILMALIEMWVLDCRDMMRVRGAVGTVEEKKEYFASRSEADDTWLSLQIIRLLKEGGVFLIRNVASLQQAYERVRDLGFAAEFPAIVADFQNDERKLMLAFLGAIVPGRANPITPASRFLRRDGDIAIGHRIYSFLTLPIVADGDGIGPLTGSIILDNAGLFDPDHVVAWRAFLDA